MKFSRWRKRDYILMFIMIAVLVGGTIAMIFIPRATLKSRGLAQLTERTRVTALYQRTLERKLHFVRHSSGLECVIYQPDGVSCNWTRYNNKREDVRQHVKGIFQQPDYGKFQIKENWKTIIGGRY